MDEQGTPPGRTAWQDAIDIDDLAYAMTGARVRRLTMPNGSHWFAAVDVARGLGYANPREAIARHVPAEHTATIGELIRSATGSDPSARSPGHGLRTGLRLVDLPGLVRLATAGTAPQAEPFKRWVAAIVATVQRNGGYALRKAEVQPTAGGTAAYAVPREIADALVRLEKSNLRLSEELAAAQRETLLLRGEAVRMQGTIEHLLGRIAESLERLAPHRPPAARSAGTAPPPSAPGPLTGRRPAPAVADDLRTAAAYLAPRLVEHRGCRRAPEQITARAGLTAQRVQDCLRVLLKRGILRQVGTAAGEPARSVLP